MYADVFTALKYILPDPAITRMPRKLSSLIRGGFSAMRWVPPLGSSATSDYEGPGAGWFCTRKRWTEKEGERSACVFNFSSFSLNLRGPLISTPYIFAVPSRLSRPPAKSLTPLNAPRHDVRLNCLHPQQRITWSYILFSVIAFFFVYSTFFPLLVLVPPAAHSLQFLLPVAPLDGWKLSLLQNLIIVFTCFVSLVASRHFTFYNISSTQIETSYFVQAEGKVRNLSRLGASWISDPLTTTGFLVF